MPQSVIRSQIILLIVKSFKEKESSKYKRSKRKGGSASVRQVE